MISIAPECLRIGHKYSDVSEKYTERNGEYIISYYPLEAVVTSSFFAEKFARKESTKVAIHRL